jgi:hypothetical protein
MAFCLSKLPPHRRQGVHPALVRLVERAIQITTQDGSRQACARMSAKPRWLRAAPAGP